MKSFILYLNCGRVNETRDAIWYQVTKVSDIDKNIVPFFNKYPIVGIKSSDF